MKDSVDHQALENLMEYVGHDIANHPDDVPQSTKEAYETVREDME